VMNILLESNADYCFGTLCISSEFIWFCLFCKNSFCLCYITRIYPVSVKVLYCIWIAIQYIWRIWACVGGETWFGCLHTSVIVVITASVFLLSKRTDNFNNDSFRHSAIL
jgi:hypothetical protein